MRKDRPRVAGRVLALLAAALWPGAASAHPTQAVTLQVIVAPTGEFRASLSFDLLAYALGKPSIDAANEEMEALLDGPRPALARALAVAGDQLRREVVVRTDAGDAALSGWKLPGLPEVDAALARHVVPRILMAGDIAFSGTLPAAARTVSIRLPYVLGETVHVYAVPGGDGEGQLVAAGDYSNVVKFKLRAVEAPPRPPASRREAAVGVAAVAVALLAALWFRRRPWHRRVGVSPA